MPRLHLGALAAAFLAAAASAQIAVGPVVHPTNGHRYYRTTPRSLVAARAVAAQLGGTLATVHSAALNDWLRVNLAAVGGNTTPCSLGLNDLAVEGAFVWESGDPVFYTNWNTGEPNNQNNEDVASINPTTGRWNDIITTAPVPAIVEVSGPIRVPAEYPTIQAAIDAALDGQTILVAPGTYTGNIDFGYKHLVVRSERGAAETAIRTLDPMYGIVLNGNQGPETVLEGFTITPDSLTRILVLLGQGQTLRACRVAGALGAGVLTFGDAVVSDCLLLGPYYSISTRGPGSATVQNCNILSVALLELSEEGPTTPRMNNCIIRAQVQLQGASLLRASYCDIQGGAPGLGNIDADPMFTSAPGPDGVYDLNDDYTLRPGSPCIDAGSSAARAATGAVAEPLDAGRRNRFVDDPASPGSGVDMGAFEFAPAPPALPGCPIDFNNDGFVDFFDYDDFVAAFETGC